MQIIKQASALPFRKTDDKLEILIITSRSKKRWIIPKGIIEQGDSDINTALKEAQEEAGINGNIGVKNIGKYSYKKWGGICKVIVYPMEVTEILDNWPEMTIRSRMWVSSKDAIDKVKPDKVAEIIKNYVKDLEK
jgi:phosphohistidine phosphatase